MSCIPYLWSSPSYLSHCLSLYYRLQTFMVEMVIILSYYHVPGSQGNRSHKNSHRMYRHYQADGNFLSQQFAESWRSHVWSMQSGSTWTWKLTCCIHFMFSVLIFKIKQDYESRSLQRSDHHHHTCARRSNFVLRFYMVEPYCWQTQQTAKTKKHKRGNLLYSWGFNRHQGSHWRLLPPANHQGFRIQPIETSRKRQTRQQRARIFRWRLVKSRLVCWLALTKIWICYHTVSILWVCCLFVRTDIWQRSLDLPPAKPQLLVSLVITDIFTLIIQIA